MIYEILLVDDDVDIRRALSEGLEPPDIEIHISTASTGREALTEAKRLRPNLMLIDFNLGDITGMKVVEDLRRDPDLQEMRIIMLTAEGTRRNLWESIDLGIDDFITKPFDLEELEIRVYQQLVGEHRRAQA